jgi:hypothetical protein
MLNLKLSGECTDPEKYIMYVAPFPLICKMYYKISVGRHHWRPFFEDKTEPTITFSEGGTRDQDI